MERKHLLMVTCLKRESTLKKFCPIYHNCDFTFCSCNRYTNNFSLLSVHTTFKVCASVCVSSFEKISAVPFVLNPSVTMRPPHPLPPALSYFGRA